MITTFAALGAALSLALSPLPAAVVEVEHASRTEDSVASSGGGPIVHIELAKPDPDRGVLMLARHRNTTTTAVPDAVVITTLYDELCSEPCGIPIDVSERPLFFFVRDGQPVSYAFRLNQFDGEVTLRVQPQRNGMVSAGIVFTCIMLLPIGIPLWVVGSSKVWSAPGQPGSTTTFTKLKKAKV